MKPFALLVAATGPATLVSMLGRDWFDSIRIDSSWVERLGWTLIHTVWQFALIAVVAAVLHWILRHRSARARYLAGVVLLGAMAVAPSVTWFAVDTSQPTAVQAARNAAVHAPDQGPLPRAVSFSRLQQRESDAGELQSLQGATPLNRHAVDPRAEPGTDVAPRVAPHERPSLSWVAAIRSRLAPRLPLLVSLW
jgi:hypothetical protein